MTEQQQNRIVTEHHQLRADIYQLLAALLRQAPTPELIGFLAELELESDSDNEMLRAWHALKLSAQTHQGKPLEDEYFNLFIGLGHGEVIPYTSWYLTGSLMDQPLALLRQDLAQLGFARQEEVKEPEDHLAALCEVMAFLLLEGGQADQLTFWQRHLEPWVSKFFDDLAKASNASFYTGVAALGQAFFATEATTFSNQLLDVKVQQTG
ncbi:TorD/DmsD family molecular chaperone [Ferrimonas marina]|uniref:Chaperone TorD involved in molybdoenzyme TorA maturation n=1 Tax=Ferrimonas marina TaxID=299255 RepID=A0A1M5XVT7_9GAMM|nr:molecular chaperone TorD family protein [Ferrimonas marina]SHI03941.1 chaperone TorD involved in molybdoenzyme TorA maturation [Ferrimonas marina]